MKSKQLYRQLEKHKLVIKDLMGLRFMRDLNLCFVNKQTAWNDAVEEACESGIGVIAEPGGSIRDGDAVDCCNKYGVALLFTNVRHFRH